MHFTIAFERNRDTFIVHWFHKGIKHHRFTLESQMKFLLSIYVGMPSSNFRMLSLLPDEQDLLQNFETLWNDQARCHEHPQ